MKRLVTTFFLVAGCASSSSGIMVRGEVEQALDGAPVEDARVSMSCPQALKESGLRLLATTDASGSTTHQAPPSSKQTLVGGCQIFVTADGFSNVTYPVESVCSRWAGTRCMEVRLRARMKPKTKTERQVKAAPVRLTIVMQQDGIPFHQQELLAPGGQPATINLDNNGVPYKVVVVPTWTGDTSVSLEGNWSTGNGTKGVVSEVTNVNTPLTIDFGTDNIVMLLTPRRE